MPRHLLSAASVAVAIATGASVCAPTAGASLSFQPEIGLPASNVAVIGASPGEAPGETWAQGQLGGVPALVEGAPLANTEVLLRYTTQSGTWQVVPVDGSQGEPIPIHWWGSEATPDGGVVLVGSEEPEFKGALDVVTRNPGGAFVKAPPPSSTPTASEPAPVLGSGEQLLATSASAAASTKPVMAALDEANHLTGVLIAPVRTNPADGSDGSSDDSGGEVDTPGVLHYDGVAWTREPICEQYVSEKCTAPSETLTALALSASSPGNAWLLADTSTEPLMLFQRVQEPGGKQVWVRRRPASWLLDSGTAPLSGESVSALKQGPMLTAVGQDVWVDVALTAGTGTGDGTVLVSPDASGEVAGAWCYSSSSTSLCPGDGSLGAPLPADYGSFAWPGAGAGTRVITGLPEGALLILREDQGEFAYTVGGGAGGADGAIGPGGVTLGTVPGSGGIPSGGAAFSSPEEGWLGAGGTPATIHVTANPAADSLLSWPAPFREPLLAIAGQPGATPGESSAQALAVGVDGEVARYIPGEGWTPEYLYNSSGERQTPNLRGVAWPEPERAYAVGDEGAMWVWESSTDQWEPDPAEPIGFRGQLTGIAFSPIEPDTGYAVGKQGVLLSYGKSWTQEAPPPGLSQANFTSVAFAGGEAIASYRMLNPADTSLEIGGLIVNSGAGWQVEPEAQALLASLPSKDTVLSKVAGVPDGGAVAAGPGVVIERDSATGHWHLSSQPLPEAENVAALAAIEEGSSVRALVSLDTNDNPNNSILYQEVDNPPGPALGQYGVLLGPDPIPDDGYLLRQTAGGWQDQEHLDYPEPAGNDLPGWPDAVLALLVAPSGNQGWAVGGQTGAELTTYGQAGAQEAAQTAGVMRYGAGPAPPQATDATISAPAGQASFAVGGNAQCASTCANLANEQLGPNAWLTQAISRAGQIAGLHAFLYTGGRIASTSSSVTFTAQTFGLELQDYADLLGGDPPLPVHAAISPSEVASGSSAQASAEMLGGIAPAGSVPAPEEEPAPPAGSAAYSFESPGAGGTVRVIVLDYSQSELSPHDTVEASCPSNWKVSANQLQWLCSQLHYAKQKGVPAIVMGSAAIADPNAPGSPVDAQAVDQVLTGQVPAEQGAQASAYLFDSTERNVSETIGSGSSAVHAYGSGTLGYVSPPLNDPEDFLGASGFLVVSVDAAQRDAETNKAPVSVALIPNIGQLGLNATNGTLVRRSQVALFEGLARRPLGGVERIRGSSGDTLLQAPGPYVTIPESCLGANCSQFIAPEYTFTSSNPKVGDFVEQDPSSINPRAVLQVNGKTVHDSSSGLFCAYNAGTTTVTLTTGGLSYSEQVTVEAGSVEQPCQTVPLLNAPTAEESQSPPTVVQPTPTESPPTTEPFLALTPPPPPAAPTPVVHHRASPAQIPAALLAPAALLTPLRAALPPPPPQAARPTPPSGTSAVEALEREREEQGAVDVVHNAAVYEPDGHALPPWSALALLVIAAAIGASVRRRRPDRSPAAARANIAPHTRGKR